MSKFKDFQNEIKEINKDGKPSFFIRQTYLNR